MSVLTLTTNVLEMPLAPTGSDDVHPLYDRDAQVLLYAGRRRGTSVPRHFFKIRDFSCCTPVFYAILVILRTCIFRDARAMRERERKNKSRKTQKITKSHV